MLTDDDLTTELRAAFRDTTTDLRYAGRVPTPRNRLAVGVPLAATAVAAATLAVVWAGSAEAPAPAPEATPTQGPVAPRMVTDTIRVAGYSFTYRYAAGEQPVNDLYAMLGDVSLPADAKPIDAPEGVKAWAGTDDGSGDRGVWVRPSTAIGGAMYAVLSPTWTDEQLASLLEGEPSGAPAVER
ncbi:hypothetical protein GCM10027062_19280 [Nocardioides hungaricus]